MKTYKVALVSNGQIDRHEYLRNLKDSLEVHDYSSTFSFENYIFATNNAEYIRFEILDRHISDNLESIGGFMAYIFLVDLTDPKCIKAFTDSFLSDIGLRGAPVNVQIVEGGHCGASLLFEGKLKDNHVQYINKDFRPRSNCHLNQPLLSLAHALTKNKKLIFLPKLIPTNNPMIRPNNNSCISTDTSKNYKAWSQEIPASDSFHYMKLSNSLFDKMSKILAICNDDLLKEFTKSEY